MVRLIKTPDYSSVYIPRAHMPRIQAKVRVRFVNKGHRVVDFANRWKRSFLKRSGAAIRMWVIKSFRRRANKATHSPKGKPPYLHDTKASFIKKAIGYAVNYSKSMVFVGVLWSVAHKWGKMHEFGGLWPEKKKKSGGSRMVYYPPRPFIRPAFERWKSVDNTHVKSSMRAIMKSTKEWAYKL